MHGCQRRGPHGVALQRLDELAFQLKGVEVARRCKGEVTATYDTASKKLSWKGSYSDLSGPATAAHFHGPAAAGKNAGVAVPIFAGGAAKSPFEGSATLTDAQAKELMGGEWYANIHTANNKAGEIRGQMAK